MHDLAALTPHDVIKIQAIRASPLCLNLFNKMASSPDDYHEVSPEQESDSNQKDSAIQAIM